ncbi:hypothetical protein SLS55_007503 [Diplodia seriata]|uniref:Short-chain dehydrogenase reductase sdr n=1 Tax=Diplodia seriata TaxID=420778 RepID=A0ABR3CCF5_9PEZI
MATALVTNGARVIITALPTDPIDAAVRDLNALGRPSGGTAEGFPTDLSSKPAIAALAAHLTDTLRLPRLDVLVSNAGIRRDPPAPCAVTAAALPELQASMWSHRAADWADTFAVNTTAHYFLSVALVHLLAAAAERDVEVVQVSAAPEGGGEGESVTTTTTTTTVKGREVGCGSVVVTSSCASMHNCTNIDLTSYAASKAATDHLVAMLAAKFARWYVRVNAINPGCESFSLSRLAGLGA